MASDTCFLVFVHMRHTKVLALIRNHVHQFYGNFHTMGYYQL